MREALKLVAEGGNALIIGKPGTGCCRPWSTHRHKYRRSVILTSNRVVQDWGRYLGDQSMAALGLTLKRILAASGPGQVRLDAVARCHTRRIVIALRPRFSASVRVLYWAVAAGFLCSMTRRLFDSASPVTLGVRPERGASLPQRGPWT